MHLDHPFHFDDLGRTARADDDAYIRGLIEQVLFTAPGERVNRPTFGCGLRQLVFEPGGDALAASTQLSVQGALQEWLGELIQVEAVTAETRDSTLIVAVQYVTRRSRQRRVHQFQAAG
jgi:uncharacterized protein